MKHLGLLITGAVLVLGIAVSSVSLFLSEVFISILVIAMALISFFPSTNAVRSHARQVIYIGLPLSLAVLSFLHFETFFFTGLGDWAERLLVFLLLIKPVAIIFNSSLLKRAVYYRRELGLATFWLFAAHATGLIIIKQLTVGYLFAPGFLLAGTLAGIAMIILAVTSNKPAARLLKRNWKRVQYLSYPALLITLAHSSLAAEGNLNKLYVIGGIFVVLKIIEIVLVKKRLKK